MSRRLLFLALVGAAVAVAAVSATTVSARTDASSVTALPSSSCGPLIYHGKGKPNFIIPSDLPLQGAIRKQTVEISQAMLWALKHAGWRAGKYRIAYQSCDDSTAQTGGWDTAKCATNANLYANDSSVIGVLGTFNSGCAKIEVPVLNQAGPLAMVSPANTNPGLTKKWDVGEPQKYYPTGKRNYARVVATDDIQGPADAVYSKSLGIKKVFVLNDKQTYGVGVATTYKNAAAKLGITVAGFEGWDAKASSYEALATSIKASGATAVFLGGINCNNGAKLMQDIKSVDPSIQLQMPDGFSDPSSNGTVADGAYISVAGEPPNKLKGAGRTFVKSFGKQLGRTPNPYSAYGAESMQVMLKVVARSGGNRARATRALFGLKVVRGILGTFRLNSAGDTNLQPITIYRQANGKLIPVKTIIPAKSLTG